MGTYRITFRNFDLNNSNVERAQNLVKNLYYHEGKEPKDWKLFENEITIESQQDMGGDCVLVTFDGTPEFFKNAILKSINRKNEIRSIEKQISTNDFEKLYKTRH